MSKKSSECQSLFQNPAAYKDHPEKYQEHLLEQYKLALEMADRVSGRRITENSFFSSINTALTSTLAVLGKEGYFQNFWTLFPILAGLILCVFWIQILTSSKRLSFIKLEMITEMEARLPLGFYTVETAILKKQKMARWYKPITLIESRVPLIFGAIYSAMTIIVIYNVWVKSRGFF